MELNIEVMISWPRSVLATTPSTFINNPSIVSWISFLSLAQSSESVALSGSLSGLG